MATRPSYYDILDLQPEEPGPSAESLKKAYRKALLLHHPDKTSKAESAAPSRSATKAVSVDDVALAYKTLSDPALKAEYDRWLAANRSSDTSAAGTNRTHHTGLETVDLEDLAFDEDSQAWTRECRCGVGGYVVTEDELEMNLDDRELIVGCKGCSLWLRVLFSVEE